MPEPTFNPISDPTSDPISNLDQVIAQYGGKLLRYATSILYNHQDAEDIVQDVFLTALENKDAFAGGNLSAWLYKITYHKAINHLKRRRFIFFSDAPKDSLTNTGETPLDNQVLDILKTLKPPDRALVYARTVEGYSYQELAQQMDATPAALRKRYARARAKLAKELSTQTPDLSPSHPPKGAASQ